MGQASHDRPGKQSIRQDECRGKVLLGVGIALVHIQFHQVINDNVGQVRVVETVKGTTTAKSQVARVHVVGGPHDECNHTHSKQERNGRVAGSPKWDIQRAPQLHSNDVSAERGEVEPNTTRTSKHRVGTLVLVLECDPDRPRERTEASKEIQRYPLPDERQHRSNVKDLVPRPTLERSLLLVVQRNHQRNILQVLRLDY